MDILRKFEITSKIRYSLDRSDILVYFVSRDIHRGNIVMHIFNFGNSGYIKNAVNVRSDTSYGLQENGMIYGLLGISGSETIGMNGMLDGFEYNREVYPVQITEGSGYIEVDYDKYSPILKRCIKDGYIPLRFSVELEEHRYYTVTVRLLNTSNTENTRVTLCSEKRRFILFEKELLPGERIDAAFNVNLESVFSHGALYPNNVLNVSICGSHAGLAEIRIKKHDDFGKTLWILGDSTVCDYISPVPCYPLRNYGGTGAFLSKYINPEIAVSNQAEGGLCASDEDHFDNTVKHMRKGDFLYVQYGINDKQQYNDIAQYRDNLEKYYTAAREKGVKLIIASCTQRHEKNKNWNSQLEMWQSTMRDYACAASEFVERKKREGKRDIVFLDVNKVFINRLNMLIRQVFKKHNEIKPDGQKLIQYAADYYYRTDKHAEVDPEHINEAGADNTAFAIVTEMKHLKNSSEEALFDEIVENARDELPYVVVDIEGMPADLYSNAEVTDMEYPVIIEKILINNGRLEYVKLNAAAENCRGVIQIYNGDDLSTEFYSTGMFRNKLLFDENDDKNYFPRGCIYRINIVSMTNKYLSLEWKDEYWG